MIRLPPTAIVLGESDLREFSQRESRRKLAAQLDLLERLTVDTHNEHSHNIRQQNQQDPHANSNSQRKYELPIRQPSTSRNLDSPPRKASITTTLENVECSILSESLLRFGDNSSDDEPVSDEQEHGSIRRLSQGNDSHIPTATSPEKDDDFHYGGFTESPNQNNNSTTFSSFGRSPCSRLDKG
jgi:hypothetical protein